MQTHKEQMTEIKSISDAYNASVLNEVVVEKVKPITKPIISAPVKQTDLQRLKQESKENVDIVSAYKSMVNEAREDLKVKYFNYEGTQFKLQRKKVVPEDKQKPWTLRSIASDAFTIVIDPTEWDGINDVITSELDEYKFEDKQKTKWKVTKIGTDVKFENESTPAEIPAKVESDEDEEQEETEETTTTSQNVVIPVSILKIFS